MKIAIADSKDLETHSLVTRVIRIFTVPVMNGIPPRLLQKVMRATSHDARTVVENSGSTIALEAMYTRHHRSLFSRGILQGLADLFWHHCISQPKALRNRLKIVERSVEEELIRIVSQTVHKSPIKILSVGGGSARALIHSIHRLLKGGLPLRLRVVILDRDLKAIKLGKEIAKRHDIQDIFEWVNDDARNIPLVIQKGSIDIVEMVGLLDYFSDEEGTGIMKNIKEVLKEDGLFIFANVYPNGEMPFVYHLGWPKMYYRKPADFGHLLAEAGFSKEIAIIFEPLRVHIIAKARK